MQTVPLSPGQALRPATAPVASPLPRRRMRAGLALLALVCLLAATAHAQVSIFMRIGGKAGNMGSPQNPPVLPGSSTDALYSQWINVLGMNHGITLPVTISGGQPVPGKPQHADLQVTKAMDLSSPALALLANGSAAGLPVNVPIDYVTLDFRAGGGITPQVFYRVELQQVFVTGYSVQASGETPGETISFHYSKIQWTYLPYNNGKPGTPITTGWDVAANRPL